MSQTDHAATVARLKRQRTKRLARLGARVYYLRKKGREQEMYDLICNEFVAMGGVYIKFLQGVLFNTPIMKRWHSPTRLHIFEKLAHEPLDIVKLLQDELRDDQLNQIALISPEPFAAGSFGQVYMGQHVNGKRIVIKVLRPMVRELLKYDLRLLSMFSKRFAAKEYTSITIRMNEAIREFRQSTLNETDYVAEAQFAHELHQAYQYNPQFLVPETYLGLCTPHLIVQDYVEGISVAELLERKEHGEDIHAYVREQLSSDLVEQMKVVGVECLAAAFSLPRVQGDPHPGNIRLLPNNRVGIIDFGIAAPAPRNKAAFFGIIEEWHRLYQRQGDMASLFEQLLRYFVNDLYRALKKLSAYMPQTPAIQQQLADAATAAGQPKSMLSNDMLKEVGRMVQNMFEGALGTRDIRTILSEGRLLTAFIQMVNKGNRFGLVVHLESSEILRAAQTYVAMIEALDVRNDVLPDLLQRTVTRVTNEHADIIHEADRIPTVSQALDTVNHWLERVATRDPVLFRQLLGLMTFARANTATAPPVPAPAPQPKQEEPHA